MARSAWVTLLFTDLAGSTQLLEGLGDEAGTEVVRRHLCLLRRAVTSHGGREVKSLGDGLMVAFADPACAARCAAAMQRAVARHNRTAALALGLRVGLHAGHAQVDGADYFGIPVVIAKRLCDACRPGQVIASELTLAGAGHEVDQLGELTLKGLSGPIAAVGLRWNRSALADVSRRVAG